jgi:hypothetical protein
MKEPDVGMGAAVIIDHTRADADTLHLMGMREGLDRWITKLDWLSNNQSNPIVARVMKEIVANMAVDRDGISVALTRCALKDKSGVMETFRKD